MKKTLAVLAALALASPAAAAITWSKDTTLPGRLIRVSKAVCDVAGGTESKPANADTSAGISLVGLRSVTVVVVASGGAMTAGGALQAYVYDAISTIWVRYPDADVVVGANTEQAASFAVSQDFDRIAFIPSGIGRASTVYIKGRGGAPPALLPPNAN